MFDFSPHVSSLTAEPFGPSEIDGHPDCARIWATITAMREETMADAEAAEEKAAKEVKEAEETLERFKERVFDAFRGIAFTVSSDEYGVPSGFSHNLVPTLNGADDEWVEMLQSGLDQLCGKLVTDHFTD